MKFRPSSNLRGDVCCCPGCIAIDPARAVRRAEDKRTLQGRRAFYIRRRRPEVQP
jgi:hypothetical protein